MRGWLNGVLAFMLGGLLVAVVSLAISTATKYHNKPAPELKCYAVQVDSQVAAEITGELVPISQPTQTVAKICFTEVEQ